MSAVNESTQYTHFSNVTIGTATGGGALVVGGVNMEQKVTALTADATLTAATHANSVVTLGSATGDTVTLPAASGSGNVYTVVVAVTATSNDHIIQVANATDEFVGVVYQADTDTGDALVAYPALDGDGYDTVTMDGSTTGGLQGDRYVITDIASGKFQLEGHQNATGTVATPLSAAVA